MTDYITKLLNGQPVEWRTLGEVCESRNGYTPSKANPEYWEGGTIPWFRMEDIRTSGGILSDAIQHITPQAVKRSGLFREGSIIVATTATIGEHALLTTDALANQQLTNFAIRPAYQEQLLPKFLYYYFFILDEWCKKNVQVSSFPSVNVEQLKQQPIPIPPLAVQRRIVEILDAFSELTAELEAELEGRRKQYAYYRERLLTLPDALRLPLGQVGTFVRGNGLQKKDLTESGIPAIHYEQIYTHYGTTTHQTKSFVTEETASKLRKVDYGDVVIATTSENLYDVCKAVVYLVEEQGVTGGHATIFKPSAEILGKYFAYYTQTQYFHDQKRKIAKGTKVIDVSASDLAKLTIPVPPMEEQRRIVEVLDRFSTLCESLTEGLPREIELRRKQYEYYREKLLTFPQP